MTLYHVDRPLICVKVTASCGWGIGAFFRVISLLCAMMGSHGIELSVGLFLLLPRLARGDLDVYTVSGARVGRLGRILR